MTRAIVGGLSSTMSSTAVTGGLGNSRSASVFFALTFFVCDPDGADNSASDVEAVGVVVSAASAPDLSRVILVQPSSSVAAALDAGSGAEERVDEVADLALRFLDFLEEGCDEVEVSRGGSVSGMPMGEGGGSGVLGLIAPGTSYVSTTLDLGTCSSFTSVSMEDVRAAAFFFFLLLPFLEDFLESPLGLVASLLLDVSGEGRVVNK